MENEKGKEKLTKLQKQLLWIAMLSTGIIGYKLGGIISNTRINMGLRTLCEENADFKETLGNALANHYKILYSKKAGS